MSQALSVTLQLVRSEAGEGGREITSQDYRQEVKYSVGVILRFGRRTWTFGDFLSGGQDLEREEWRRGSASNWI